MLNENVDPFKNDLEFQDGNCRALNQAQAPSELQLHRLQAPEASVLQGFTSLFIPCSMAWRLFQAIKLRLYRAYVLCFRMSQESLSFFYQLSRVLKTVVSCIFFCVFVCLFGFLLFIFVLVISGMRINPVPVNSILAGSRGYF